MPKKWVDKVNNITVVNVQMTVIKVLIQGNICSVIPIYAPQCGLGDRQKDSF